MKFKISKIEDFRIVCKLRTFNLLAQIVLAIVFFLGVNYLASGHYLSKDFSASKSNSLSPESVAYINDLKKPVDIYMTLRMPSGGGEAKAVEESQALIDEVARLLSRYEYESLQRGEKKIKVHILDPLIDRRTGDELVRRFSYDIDNSVIVACGDKSKKLTKDDLYDIEDGVRKSFKGEQAVSAAILYVSNDKQKKIYFLRGHGELNYKNADINTGLSEFANVLTLRGYKLDNLDLTSKAEIPSDADMIVVAAPQAEFLPQEIDVIRKYLLYSAGRMMVFLRLGGNYGLDDIFYEWGIRADDMMVIDTKEFESVTGDMIARLYPAKPHEIVKYMVDMNLPVQFGSVKPVREDITAPQDGGLSLWPLIYSSDTSWGEKSYRQEGTQVYNDEVDLRGPLSLAMLAARNISLDFGVGVRSGRLAVFGDENFITNGRFNALGNSKLALNTVNWMFDENTLLNIPPRKVDRFSLTISRGDINKLMWRFTLLPAFILLAGFITYIFRRQ